MRTAWLTSLVRTVLFAASCGFAAANIEPAFAGLNTNISISDNGTHIDRGTIYVNSPFLTASGGVAPYTFSLDPTTPLPSGMSLNSDGSLSGVTCGSNGSYRFNATATDVAGDFNTATNLNLVVNKAPA